MTYIITVNDVHLINPMKDYCDDQVWGGRC